MNSSTLSSAVANASGLLTDTWSKSGRRIPFWFDDSIGDFKAGAGGVISNAKDLVRWLAVLLNEGQDPATNKTIFSKSVFDAVTTSRWITSGKPQAPYGDSIFGYGMGWRRSSFGEVDVRAGLLYRSSVADLKRYRRSYSTAGASLASRRLLHSRLIATSASSS